MSSPGTESEPADLQLLIDSIPALIHTSLPDGYLDYFNRRWLVEMDGFDSSRRRRGSPVDYDRKRVQERGCLKSDASAAMERSYRGYREAPATW